MTLDYGFYLGGKGYIPLNEINHRISEIDTALAYNEAKKIFVSSDSFRLSEDTKIFLALS